MIDVLLWQAGVRVVCLHDEMIKQSVAMREAKDVVAVEHEQA